MCLHFTRAGIII